MEADPASPAGTRSVNELSFKTDAALTVGKPLSRSEKAFRMVYLI